MKPKNPKRKNKHDLPSLDFVTALSIEECRARLLSEPQTFYDRWRKFVMEGNQHFTVKWYIVSPYRGQSFDWPGHTQGIKALTDSVQYHGNLSSISNGTHVQAIPIWQAPPWLRIANFFILPVGTILTLLTIQSYMIGGNYRVFFGFLMLFILVVGSFTIVIKQQTRDVDILIRQNAQWITDWLYDTLYEPPETSIETYETQSQFQEKKQA